MAAATRFAFLATADLIPRPLAPFLRSRVLQEGTFGVSHTRVPTESRPGHVALIAGLYEDVSAVATGWKLNPVNFDSVFNRSRHTWSWGSPDILPMFEQGAVPGRVDTYMYEPEFEDFTQDALRLDYWVFDHVKHFFAEAAINQTLNKALRQDKIIFFLHLLGLDTTGHSYRPYSKEYLNNIKVVDQGVKEITELVQKFYADDRTAFVFTADHGMSDWGSHGDGHPDNTRTPFITWGSGVAAPEVHPGTIAPGHDAYSLDWGLDHIRRHDINQADIAALMSYLIGAEFPANSVGELPLSYLAADNSEKAYASLVNAKGILEMYRVKENKKKTNELRFKAYHAFDGEGSPENRIAAIVDLIANGQYEEAIEESNTLIQATLQGLRYLQTYDWLFLRALITMGYLGWMAYATTIVVNMFVVHEEIAAQRTLFSAATFLGILFALYASFIISKSPLTYYLYAFFPVVFWEEVYAHRQSLYHGRLVLFGHIQSAGGVATLFLHTIFYIAVIQSLAVGYIYREVLTGLFVLAAAWPVMYGLSFLQNHALLIMTWAASCLTMSTFTLLPAMKVESIGLILAGGFVMFLVGFLYLILEDTVLADFSWAASSDPSLKKSNKNIQRTLTGIQLGLILLSMLVTRSSALSLQAKRGLPVGNQVLGWAILIIFLTCAPTFVILTISYEGLFYVAFSVTLLVWVRLEYAAEIFCRKHQQNNGSLVQPNTFNQDLIQHRELRLSDARVALFFLVLLQSAFFSTGNVASVSSFSLDSVYRLIPVFDPFSQGALLILKLMIPFALISANLGVLNKRLGVAPSALFMVVMAISDILTLYFFWVVKDEGSWLEIGSTISHFAIASLLCVFVAGLEGVSTLFISGINVGDGQSELDPTTSQSGSTMKNKGAPNGNSYSNEAKRQ
ncbi:phosphoethanolamine transferase class N [Metarhizium acridum CQMa 102]|uniref:GPI ethanolamine phosphate transferase 1 n=1 Tax=Metarhizium acridum (strain CQMa 102) TaxID=655827 RepID=E9EDF4_METAQ|nr:phosphoethanolamine transferase class N [Metarhizium acridum CQMa 102]EFY86094.1 phosphoethanolamine transferase class N [Metarhizium acridum CQMa 102]